MIQIEERTIKRLSHLGHNRDALRTQETGWCHRTGRGWAQYYLQTSSRYNCDARLGRGEGTPILLADNAARVRVAVHGRVSRPFFQEQSLQKSLSLVRLVCDRIAILLASRGQGIKILPNAGQKQEKGVGRGERNISTKYYREYPPPPPPRAFDARNDSLVSETHVQTFWVNHLWHLKASPGRHKKQDDHRWKNCHQMHRLSFSILVYRLMSWMLI